MYRKPDEPSIFPGADTSAVEPSVARTDRGMSSRRPDPLPVTRPPEVTARDDADRSNRQLMVLGSMGLGIVALVGFIAASLLDTPRADRDVAAALASATPSVTVEPREPTPSPSPESSIQPTAAATSRPTQAATPAPTPAGPPEVIAVGGWATVAVGELNVRAEPGLTSTSVYRLVDGAIARVFEGPVARDGLNWYRIGSLGGAKGWAASGPEAAPFLTTFSEDSDLLHCGKVESEVLEIVDGAVRSIDPVRVGGLALPAAAFTDEEAAVLELIRATRADACFGAQMVPVEVPVMYTQTSVSACGRLTGDGASMRLRPVAGSQSGIEFQVKETAIVGPTLLGRDPNVDARARLAAQGDGISVCFHGGVNETAAGVDTQISIDGAQCVVVDEHTADYMSIRSTSGGEALRFVFAPDQRIEVGTVAVGNPIEMGISAFGGGSSSSFWAWEVGAC